MDMEILNIFEITLEKLRKNNGMIMIILQAK